MATSFPVSLDELINPQASNSVQSPSHSEQHADANDAIEALEAKVGIDGSSVVTSHDYKIAQLQSLVTSAVAGAKSIYQDVRNQSGSAFTKATPVYVSGSTGASGQLLVSAASNATEATSSKTMGITTSAISNNSNGQVISEGILEGIDTTGAADGDPVWLGVNGAKIYGLANKPSAPAHLVFLGIVIRGGQANTGSMYVKIQNGFELHELHNVEISSLVNGNIFAYDSTTQTWKNTNTLQSTSSTIPLVVKGATSQTADLQQWQDSSGNLLGRFHPTAGFLIYGIANINGGLAPYLNTTTTSFDLFTNMATNKGLIIRGAASQTANLQEWQINNGTVKTSISSDGTFGTTGNVYANRYYYSANGTASGTSVSFIDGNNAGGLYIRNIDLLTPNAAFDNITPLTVSGNVNQTADLQRWNNGAGTTVAKVDKDGNITAIGLTVSGDFTVNGTTTNINTTNLIVEDKNITIADVATPTDTTANGAGITIKGTTDKTFNWVQSTGRFTSSEPIQSPGLVVSTPTNTTNAGVFYNSAGTIVFNVDTSLNQINIGGGLSGVPNNFASAWGYDSSLNAGYISFATGIFGGDSFAIRRTNHIASGDYTLSTLGNLRFSTASGKNFNFNNGNIGIATTAIGTNNKIIVNPYSTIDNLATVQINTSAATNKGLVVQGYASQTANLQEWQNSAGTVLAYIDKDGQILTPRVNLPANGLIVEGGTGPYIQMGTSATYLYTRSASNKGLIVQGAASQTANLQEWQNNSTSVLAKIDKDGNFNNQLSYASILTTSVVATGGNISTTYGFYNNLPPSTNAGMAVMPWAANLPGAIVRGFAGQTANLQEWQNSSGNILSRIGNNGTFFWGGNSYLSASLGTALIGNNYASDVALKVKSAASQTANLQEWQNSSGTIIASVDASGNISDAFNTKWLSPIGSGSNDAPTIQALIDAGKKEIRLGSGQWTFSTRIKVPNGVTLRGIGSSTTSTTGTRVNAVALIASEGTVRDIMFTGAGENAQSELGGGGIAVLGGRVINCSVNDSRWVLAPTRQPHGYLKNFMSKMQSGYGSVKVAVLGDSLSENTSTTSWYGYLFNSTTTATGYYLGSYFSHQIAPSEVDNMAIGGQGAYLLSAQLAMTKETLRTGDYVNQVLDGDRVSTSPFFNRDYNLAILAIGQNGGEDWKAHLEYTVKTIRDKGIDVIILTQNPAASNPTSRAGDEYFYRSMAETYGCLLVDTQAYFRLEVEFGRALGTTADLFGDSVHQSALGHQLYAKAILNALLDYDSTAAVPANKTVVSRSYIPAQADRAAAIAGLNSYYLVKRPDSLRGISGVTYTTATDTSIRNPIYGRGTTTNSVATIASGGYATWGVEYATAAYVIYRENATANTLTVALQAGGSTLATLTTGVTNGRTSVQKVMLSGGYPANRAIRITNTSGDPVQIYGVVFETHADVAFNRNTDGSYAGVKLNGSWTYSDFLSMASYGGYLTPHTSTTNDSVTFKFYGDGLRFATSYGKNSGIIQVKIDDTTYTAVDTYNNIGEYGVYTHFYGGLEYGLHTATITLTGANASVTGDLGHGARFGLHRISAVRSEWYLTQDQQFAPNSDTSSIVNSVSSIRMGSVGGANIATFYNETNGYGAGSITSVGTFNINGANMGFPYTSTGATLNVNAGAASIVPLTVRGVASQTANLQEWQNSAGTVLTRIASDGSIYRGATTIDSYGAIYTTETMAIGANAGQRFASGGMTIINRESASAVIFGVKGISSQTGDLTQWRNSSDNILAKIDANGNFSAITKSFDIPHPTKENMRLRYASLEGPENGVYIRGTTKSNIIELPDYWTGLVHEDSITVSLTAVGSAQNIYVEKIENNKVYIGGELIKAFFTVYGERKDIDKLTVEY